MGEGFSGTDIKDTWTNPKRGRIEGGRWGWLGWGQVVGGKQRQLYLNNNKKRKKRKDIVVFLKNIKFFNSISYLQDQSKLFNSFLKVLQDLTTKLLFFQHFTVNVLCSRHPEFLPYISLKIPCSFMCLDLDTLAFLCQKFPIVFFFIKKTLQTNFRRLL